MNAPSSAAVRTRRLFLALCPDASVQQKIDAQVRRWSWCPGSSLYAAEDWHVTLHFLGHVPPDQVAVIAAGADLPMEPFQWVLDQPQHWSSGLVVLCPSTVPPALRSLHERLGAMLQGLNQSVDPRPYQPHLTLARHADCATPPADIAPIVWPVHGFALVTSTGHSHPRYEVVRHYAQHAPSAGTLA